MEKILIIEDDEDIALLEKDYLEVEHFHVTILKDGSEVLSTLSKTSFDLILLDIMLPHTNGYDLCKEIRTIYDTPIIMVTAKGEPIDVIKGLGLGSDDYIIKPFDPSILVARIKASLSSYKRHKKISSELIVQDLKILPDQFQVFKNGKEIRFPHKEFELLKYLAENANVVISKENLFEMVWGMESSAEEATVTVHINRIREKIEDDPSQPKIIETIWGVGYRLNK